MRRLAAWLGVLLAFGLAMPARAITIQNVVSPGGIHAWLVEDHQRKVITLDFAIRGGAASDPADKTGLSLFAMSLLDEGAGPYDSEQYQGRLADLSAAVEFDAEPDFLVGGLETLLPHRDEVFRLLGLALTEPRLDASAVARIRAEMNQLIDSEQQDPNALAAQAFLRTEFPDHPYGNWLSGDTASMARISTGDLRTFVRSRLGRDRLMVSVVGDITPQALKPLLDSTFGGLPAHAVEPVEPKNVVPSAPGEVVLVRRPLPQSVVRFGEAGIGVRDKDLYAAMVMNQILGGGAFTSRLESELREKRGLAYGVGTNLINRDHADLIMGSIGTRNEKVAEALGLIRQQWIRLRDLGPTAAEVADAKTYLNGSYTIDLDSSRAIAERLIGLQELGLGIDYFERRPKLIDAVTPADVRRVAQRLLDPSKLVFAVVGDPAGLKPQKLIEDLR